MESDQGIHQNLSEGHRQFLELAASCVVPPIVVATAGGEISFEELSVKKLRQMFLARCNLLPETSDPDLVNMQTSPEMQYAEGKRVEQVLQALRRQDGYGFDMRN